jgi:hypothetical protein
MIIACNGGYLAVAQYLLNNGGVDVNEKDNVSYCNKSYYETINSIMQVLR